MSLYQSSLRVLSFPSLPISMLSQDSFDKTFFFIHLLWRSLCNLHIEGYRRWIIDSLVWKGSKNDSKSWAANAQNETHASVNGSSNAALMRTYKFVSYLFHVWSFSALAKISKNILLNLSIDLNIEVLLISLVAILFPYVFRILSNNIRECL